MNNKKQNFVFLGICLVLVFAIYGQTIFGDFVFNDQEIVGHYALLSDINKLHKVAAMPYWTIEAGLYRPAFLLSYSFNYLLFGSSAWSFHFINLILYAFTGFLIFIFIKRLFNNQLLGYLSSILFLVLPIHTEAVANITGRAEILALFFSLLLFLEILKEKPNFWRSGLWFLIAIGSKETAIAALPIALAVVLIKEKGIVFRNIAKKYLSPLLGLIASASLYFGARFLVLGSEYFLHAETSMVENPLKFVSASSRIATAFKILGMYLKKSFWPINLCSDYSYNEIPITESFLNSGTFAGIVVLTIFIIAFFVFIKRNQILSLGSLIFIFGFLPASNFFFPTGTIAGERLIYYSSLGLCIYLASILIWFSKIPRKRKNLIFWIFVIICVFYIIVSIVRSANWINEKRLYASAAKCSPNSVLSRANLGAVYYLQGKYAEAKAELIKAQKIYNAYSKGTNTLGLVYWKQGDKKTARKLFLKALTFKFPYYGAYENLALMALEEKNYDQARKYLREFFNNDEQAVEDYIDLYAAY